MTIELVSKYALITLTETEVYMLKTAFESYTPQYKERVDINKLIKKHGYKKGMKESRIQEERPTKASFDDLKNFITTFVSVQRSWRIPSNKTYNLKLSAMDTVVIIDVLKAFINTTMFIKPMRGTYDRFRDSTYNIVFYKKDAVELLKGMKDINNALNSTWVSEIKYD